jgi:hypothetical protein
MVAKCTYFLNNRQISMLTCDGKAYAAFSGDKGHENKASDVGLKDLGPIPKGTYYIIDRQSGGRMGWLWDPVKDMYSRSKHAEWFALHPAQRPNDDWIIVDGVKRTSLRLHPIGSHGRSEGCITVVSPPLFQRLREYLKSQPPSYIPGTFLRYYGTVEVK